ncbi:glycosyltransferase [Corallincola luteus]|uniref:Glycosyltransferase n=1 Tax=Corallincola luteus TaxID=1775177 RepID=A0ABY2AJN4_9GAMM|nr:glycosyltransferase [Corallincola luteus]TCI02612.1 glycosyltransferase [Corallincola luteus]
MQQELNKPTIAIFSNHLLSYSETFIRAQGEALVGFCPHYVGSYAVEGGLKLPTEREHIIRKGFVGKLADMALKLGHVTPPVALLGKRLSPKLVHAHFGPNGLTALPWAKRLQVPLITTFHGFDATIDTPTMEQHGRLHLRFRRELKMLAEQGDLFIAVSDFIRNKLLGLGFAPEKIVRHYIGIDTTFFQPDPAISRNGSVLLVGRMVPYKGHKLLIRAMAEVQQKNPNAKLVLVGDGPEKAALEALASKLSVNVEFTGKLPPEQVKLRMQQAAVYCQTSMRLDNGHEEALALAIAEAQSVGTPAVVFQSGGMPEALARDESGFVVPVGDVAKLGESIATLLNDEDLWQRFSLRAIENVRENHDLAKQCKSLEKIYEGILSKSNCMTTKEV